MPYPTWQSTAIEGAFASEYASWHYRHEIGGRASTRLLTV